MKKILVTGATAGIGKHATLALLRAGHHVIATGRREDALAELHTLSKDLPGELETHRLDVTDEPAVRAAADRIGAIDVLVNNAGFGQLGPLETVSDAELRRQFDTNVFGLMNMTRAFLPLMRKQGSGRIVNVGSIGGRLTFPLMGAYNATKYAVESLSDALRNEVAGFGIQVSIVEPGPIKTEFTERAMSTIDYSRFDGTPYKRVVERADEIQSKFESQSAGPEVTTKAIVHAALAKRPRIRYVVPFSSRLMIAVAAFIPTSLLDKVLRLMIGMSKPAPQLAPGDS